MAGVRRSVGYLCLVLAVAIIAYIFYASSRYHTLTRAFSSYTLLSSSWEKYKQRFIQQDGRVIDHTQDNITTSEGQSYALLRAVWSDDKETYDAVWKWTKENLKRPADHLFGWRWGQREDSSYGFMSDGGENSASDADTDIAFALILAARRWGDETYLREAQAILDDLWASAVDEVQGKPYLVAGNWAKGRDVLILNPSYFSPYAWRIFARVDPDHAWERLIDPAYDLLFASGNAPLDREHAVGLPPDWVALERSSGTIIPATLPGLTTQYSFDAVRVPWRIALDYRWNNEQRAAEYLNTAFRVLGERYAQEKKLARGYAHDGTALAAEEHPVMYATALSYFSLVHPEMAKEMYEEKILNLYSNERNAFREDLPYYEQNWLWFGVASYHNALHSYDR
jgi:endo-1,4-beta-D-glucanase Y